LKLTRVKEALLLTITKTLIETPEAPSPIGQYSQAIKAGSFLFVAGQVGQDPVSGKVNSSDSEEEIRQVFRNIKKILESGGTSMANLVRTLTFVKDLNIYESFKRVRSEFYPPDVPAPVNSFIQVADLQLGANIEIESIAIIPETG
jgi:2-iminobutanoate/2-iminopropanoate deaminase